MTAQEIADAIAARVWDDDDRSVILAAVAELGGGVATEVRRDTAGVAVTSSIRRPATPAKFQGAWHARVEGVRPAPGELLTITTKGGKSWPATVKRVLWNDGRVFIVETD